MYITLVEMPEYIKDVNRLLDEESQRRIQNYLSVNPKAGDLIQGTGGIRKLRWARPGSGKSSGIRIIYYFYNESMPLFLLNAFGKSEKVNLSKSERNALAKLAAILVKNYGAKK